MLSQFGNSYTITKSEHSAQILLGEIYILKIFHINSVSHLFNVPITMQHFNNEICALLKKIAETRQGIWVHERTFKFPELNLEKSFLSEIDNWSATV